MPISKIKQAILRFGLTALSFLLLVLLSAAVEGTLALPVAFGVGVADILLMNFLCGLLGRPAKAVPPPPLPRTTQSCSPLPRTGTPAGRNWKSRRLIFLHLLPYTRGPSPPQWRGALPLCCCC